MKKKTNYDVPFDLLPTPSMPMVSDYAREKLPPIRNAWGDVLGRREQGCPVPHFPIIDKKSRFYKNCKRQRKLEAKICQDCPFRKGIEEQECQN